MSIQYFKPKIKIIGDWLEDIQQLSYFNSVNLYNGLSYCSIKSASGNINDFSKSSKGDNSTNYKYTKLIDINCIQKIIDYFKLETMRINIVKQEPHNIIPMHVDKEQNNIIRIWIALNEHPKFIYKFDESINLLMGEVLMFNPNSLHGVDNMSDIPRYTLTINGIPNLWVKNLLNSRDKIIFI